MPERLRRILRDNPVILVLYLPQVFATIAIGILIPVLPVYAASMEITYGLIGLVIGAEALGIMAGDVPAGVVSGRYGVRRTAILGLIGLGCSYLLMFMVNSVWLVIVLRFTGGFFRAFYQVAQHEYLTSHISLARRGRAISIYGGIFRMGKFIGPVIGGSVALWLGLKVPFLLVTLFCLMAAGAILVFMPVDTPVTEKKKHSYSTHDRSVWHVLLENRSILLRAGSAQLLGSMIRSGRTTLIPLFAADMLGLDVGTIGLIVSAGAFMDMLMVLPAGMIMDKLGRKWAIVPCFGGQALVMLCLPLIGSAGGLLLVEILMGLSNGIGSGTMMTLGADLAPPDARGTFLGLWRLIGDTGFMGAPLVIGAVADALILSSAALVIGGAGLLSAGIFALFVPETLKKTRKKQATYSS